MVDHAYAPRVRLASCSSSLTFNENVSGLMRALTTTRVHPVLGGGGVRMSSPFFERNYNTFSEIIPETPTDCIRLNPPPIETLWIGGPGV